MRDRAFRPAQPERGPPGPPHDHERAWRPAVPEDIVPPVRLLLALLLFLGFAASPRADTLVRIEGKTFIAPDGGTLRVKGINLGNWLMPEGYMFKFEVAKSPRQIYGAFDRLLGPERAQAFWRQFRDTYITREDIRFI